MLSDLSLRCEGWENGEEEGIRTTLPHGAWGHSQPGRRTGRLDLLQQAELGQLGQTLQQGLQALITQGLAGQAVKQRI